jgi:hypothetical protein
VEPFAKRSTVIIVATFALMIIGYYFVVTAAAADSTRGVQCSGGHFPLTCPWADGKKFALTGNASGSI